MSEMCVDIELLSQHIYSLTLYKLKFKPFGRTQTSYIDLELIGYIKYFCVFLLPDSIHFECENSHMHIFMSFYISLTESLF